MTLTKLSLRFILALGMLALAAAGAHSSQFEKGHKQVHISNLHEINDDYYVWTQNLAVDGTIKGDLVAGAYSIDLNGNVDGSTNVFGNTLSLGGNTKGSIRAFGHGVTMNGMIGGSAVVAGRTIIVEQGAVITRDAHFGGSEITISGTVVGNLHAYAEEIILKGTIEGSAYLRGKKITVIAPAVIKGTLTCNYSESVLVDTANGVILGGKSESSMNAGDCDEDPERSIATTLVLKSSQLLAAFLFGVLALMLMPAYTAESVNQLKNTFSKSAAVGVLTMIGSVLAVLFAGIAIVCLLVGLLLSDGSGAIVAALFLVIAFLMLPISAIGAVTGAIIFYTGKIALGFLVGCLVAKVLGKPVDCVRKWHLFVGLIVLSALFALPAVGTLLYIVTGTIGAGGVVLATVKLRGELQKTSAPVSTDLLSK